jgi:plasmid stabilization system protein ParE
VKPTRLLFRPLAEAQIIEAFNSSGLGSKLRAQKWMDALDEAFTSLEHFPLAYAVLFDEVRRVKVRDFPYLPLFFVEEQPTGREATVVACVHERSDPQTWRTMSE